MVDMVPHVGTFTSNASTFTQLTRLRKPSKNTGHSVLLVAEAIALREGLQQALSRGSLCINNVIHTPLLYQANRLAQAVAIF